MINGQEENGQNYKETTNIFLYRRHNHHRTIMDQNQMDNNYVPVFHLVLELSIPFLAAGDLPQIASLNRASRTIALASFETRLFHHNANMPAYLPKNSLYGVGPEQSTMELPENPTPTRPFSYQKVVTLIHRPPGRDSWREHWKRRLHIPEHLLNRSCRITDFCRVDGSDRLVMIVCQKWNVDDDEGNGDGGGEGQVDLWDCDPESWDDDDDEGILMQLWGIVYDVPNTRTGGIHDNNVNPQSLLHPTFVQALMTEPCGIEDRASFGGRFGETEFSINGRALAVMTRRPNPDFDQEGPSIIKVFQVDDRDGFVECRSIAVHLDLGDEYCRIDWCLSARGDLLSVVSQLNHESYWSWDLYDVTRPPKNVANILTIGEIRGPKDGDGFGIVQAHYFTLDNDFVMILEAKSQVEYLKSCYLPRFANKLILVWQESDK